MGGRSRKDRNNPANPSFRKHKNSGKSTMVMVSKTRPLLSIECGNSCFNKSLFSKYLKAKGVLWQRN